MTTFFIFMPAMLLSGFVLPIRNMPFVIRLVTYLNPMRNRFVIIRGLLLTGIGAAVLWPQILGLGMIGSVTLVAAVSRFRKTLV